VREGRERGRGGKGKGRKGGGERSGGEGKEAEGRGRPSGFAPPGGAYRNDLSKQAGAFRVQLLLLLLKSYIEYTMDRKKQTNKNKYTKIPQNTPQVAL